MRMHKFYVGIYNKTLIKLNSKHFFSLWETTLKLVFIDWHVSLWVPLLIHCLVPLLYKFNLIKGIAWQKLFRYFGKWSMVLYTHRKEKLLSILFLCSSLFILKFLTAILSWFLFFTVEHHYKWCQSCISPQHHRHAVVFSSWPKS